MRAFQSIWQSHLPVEFVVVVISALFLLSGATSFKLHCIKTRFFIFNTIFGFTDRATEWPENTCSGMKTHEDSVGRVKLMAWTTVVTKKCGPRNCPIGTVVFVFAPKLSRSVLVMVLVRLMKYTAFCVPAIPPGKRHLKLWKSIRHAMQTAHSRSLRMNSAIFSKVFRIIVGLRNEVISIKLFLKMQ